MRKNGTRIAKILLGAALGLAGAVGCGENGDGMHIGRVEKFEQEIILPDGRKKAVKDVVVESPLTGRKRTTCWGNKEYQAYGKHDVLKRILENRQVVYERQNLDMPWDGMYFGAPLFGLPILALAPVDIAIASCTKIRPYSGPNGVEVIERKYTETIRRVDYLKSVGIAKKMER